MKIDTQIKRAASAVHFLPTQPLRAKFCREQLRSHGWSVQQLADLTGCAWQTCANYLDLQGDGFKATKDPRTDTTRKIFHAFGFDLVFRAKGKAKGQVAL
jgi:hypothetical protein